MKGNLVKLSVIFYFASYTVMMFTYIWWEMNTGNYIIKSLELHLFFARIMKEHALFLRAGFAPVNSDFSGKAMVFKQEFENLLSQVVALSDGVVSRQVLNSGEIVTKFTAMAEAQTEKFTGIRINKEITARELQLSPGNNLWSLSTEKNRQVQQLNRRALRLLDKLIEFKESVLENVLNCEIFTMNYPLLIEHIIREAKLYKDYVQVLENEGNLSIGSMHQVECFWNRIMMEHAMFIRGLLDPAEIELFNRADEFAEDYAKLLTNCNNAQSRIMTSDSLSEAIRFRDFKMAGVEGIEHCKIRSVILPLLADHVLREANHYIRLLQFPILS